MSTQSLRTSRKYTSSPATAARSTPQIDLHHAASDKRTRHPPRTSPSATNACHAHTHTHAHAHPYTSNKAPSKSSRKNKMGQLPQQPSQSESLLAMYANMQAVEASKELEMHMQSWGMVTIIEDDDLTFGGKPLSTWYEEDRRRYSLGEDSAPSSPGFEDEEERRGRPRDRPHYHKHSHKHSEKTGKSEGQENKH